MSGDDQSIIRDAQEFDGPFDDDVVVEPEPDTLTIPIEFDPRYRSDFDGLLYLGALTDSFEWAGHSFTIKSLTVGDLLEVARISKDWEDTMGASRAYTSAICAACVLTVDGRQMVQPIARDSPGRVLERFEYIKKNWYPYSVDAIYNRYVILEARVEEMMRRVGEASSRVG